MVDPNSWTGKGDLEQQQAFIKSYAALKEKAGVREPIYFVDSVHPQHQTRLAYGWILKGQRKSIATAGKSPHLNVMGGICLNHHTTVSLPSDRVNAVSIQAFLHQLRRKHLKGYHDLTAHLELHWVYMGGTEPSMSHDLQVLSTMARMLELTYFINFLGIMTFLYRTYSATFLPRQS